MAHRATGTLQALYSYACRARILSAKVRNPKATDDMSVWCGSCQNWMLPRSRESRPLGCGQSNTLRTPTVNFHRIFCCTISRTGETDIFGWLPTPPKFGPPNLWVRPNPSVIYIRATHARIYMLQSLLGLPARNYNRLAFGARNSRNIRLKWANNSPFEAYK